MWPLSWDFPKTRILWLLHHQRVADTVATSPIDEYVTWYLIDWLVIDPKHFIKKHLAGFTHPSRRRLKRYYMESTHPCVEVQVLYDLEVGQQKNMILIYKVEVKLYSVRHAVSHWIMECSKHWFEPQFIVLSILIDKLFCNSTSSELEIMDSSSTTRKWIQYFDNGYLL